MVLYYDPLYCHTRPQRRIEIDIEPEAEGMVRLRQAIAGVLTGQRPAANQTKENT